MHSGSVHTHTFTNASNSTHVYQGGGIHGNRAEYLSNFLISLMRICNTSLFMRQPSYETSGQVKIIYLTFNISILQSTIEFFLQNSCF